MIVAQTVRLTAPTHPAYSQYVQARLAQVDTERGEVIEVFHSGILDVRFPDITGYGGDLVMKVAPADVEAVSLEVAA